MFDKHLAAALVRCLLTLHSPDGSDFVVESDAIKAIKPVPGKHLDHITANTHAVLYLGVRTGGFGITETVDEVLRMLKRCDQYQHEQHGQ